jgi:hypothetical protein
MPLGPQPPILLYPWGRAPCDECKLAARCKTQLLACHAYGAYLTGAAERQWSVVPREPQRELYVSLLSRRAGRPRKVAEEKRSGFRTV